MSQEEKDVLMEDAEFLDEELLAATDGEDDALDESMKDIKLGNADVEKKVKKIVKADDDGTSSDEEFGAADDRTGQTWDKKWKWHIELYPIDFEDMQQENFSKMYKAASYCQIYFSEQSGDLKKGEAHFFTDKFQVAKTILRNMCCKKFKNQRPFVYIYRKGEATESSDGNESAVLRLDLTETAKVRWDRQKKTSGSGEKSYYARVSNVPLGTSAEFLSIVFARAFKLIRETDDSNMEAEIAASADKQTVPGKLEVTEKKESDEPENDGDENDEECAEEELSGKFNGNLTVEGVSRTSLKGLLLGYRRATIGGQLLSILPFPTEGIDMDAILKEARERRKEEIRQAQASAQAAKTSTQAKPQAASGAKAQSAGKGKAVTSGNTLASGDKGGFKNERVGANRGAARGRFISRGSAGITRGGRGGNQFSAGPPSGAWGRGGMMKTGRQKMNEKSMRRGGAIGAGPPRAPFVRSPGDGNFTHDIHMLQSQLAMNTLQLQRQIDSLSMGRGGYREYQPGPPPQRTPPPPQRSAPPPRPRSMLQEWDQEDDWSWRSEPAVRGRFRGMRGGPMRGGPRGVRH